MPLSPRFACLASSLAAVLLSVGCGSDGEDAVPLCETPCAIAFLQAARQCAGIDGVDCVGPDCFPNGARTYALDSELRDADGALCLKRWSTATGLAWQTGGQPLRLNVEEGKVVCPDGTESSATADDSSACDPINEPSRSCNSGFCETPAPDICPADGCLCRESSCAAAFFDSVRECAGLTGEETCTIDEEAGEACYSNGARITGTEELRQLFAPDGETLCMTVSVGPKSFPERGYETRNFQVLAVDETGKEVRCPDGTQQSGCGSGARFNFENDCDPSSILVTGRLPEFGGTACCEPGVCSP